MRHRPAPRRMPQGPVRAHAEYRPRKGEWMPSSGELDGVRLDRLRVTVERGRDIGVHSHGLPIR